VSRRDYSTRPPPEEQEEPYSNEDELSKDLDLAQEVEQRRRKALIGWKPNLHSIETLKLPKKIDHPEADKYIGSQLLELKGRPKYLWDSHTRKTVVAEDWMFKEGYGALGYTWGRWRKDWYRFPGTQWDIPNIRPQNNQFPDLVCNFNMKQLTEILRRVPHVRFWWIDVLCIPQKDEHPDKAMEIAKQGAIFKNAICVLVYLWSLTEGKQLLAAIQEFDEMMRWYWKIIVPQELQAATKDNSRKALVEIFGPRLRSDPWFSSLWTLQEMILAPHSVWMALDGSYCRVNGDALTTHTVAEKFRDFLIREALNDYPASLGFNPSRNYVQEFIPKSENESKISVRK
jgi:Heterokaryon incompatibility protein (HET)